MTILDNQEVNAAILNGIAKDLGALDFSEFVDGEKFGADKLNAITAALVTPGVLSNDGNGCKVNVSDGKISVGTGTIVFVSGAKMKITEPQLLEMVPNIKTYVVAVNDTDHNRMLLYNSEALPDEDDYVLLGEVLESGDLIDKRAWSTAKVTGMDGPVYEYIKESIAVTIKHDHTETLSKVIKLSRSGYHAMVLSEGFYDVSDKVYMILDGEPISISSVRDFASSSIFYNIVYDGKSTVEIYTFLASSSFFPGSDPDDVTVYDRSIGLYFF